MEVCMKTSLRSIMMVLAIVISAFGKDVTYLQFFYTIKNVFPDVKEVAIFLPQDLQEQEQSKIASASVKMGVTAKLYLITDVQSIGNNTKLLNQKSVVLIYNAPILAEKSNRDFIIKKCAEMQIPVVTSSQDFVQAGALIGLLPDENNKLKLIVNVQQYPQIASLFSAEFSQKVGVAEIIR